VSLRRDYLLRLVEQMARVLARVRELLAAGKTSEARGELERAARGAGLDLGLALTLAPGSLLPMLSTGGEVDRSKCALFAELLYLEYHRASADAQLEQAARARDRALMLFELAYAGQPIDDEVAGKIEELGARK
jgi:hypothetical protein